MSKVMMKLGPLTFSLSTAAYESFQKNTAYRWESQSRFNNGPALQFCGHGEESVTLPGVIYPHFQGGLEQIDQMREVAAEGNPLLMVDGKGKLHGKWVIVSITEKQTVFFSNGTPRKMEFSLKLKRYFND
ncbi:MAG: phage tail protein [Desulfovibrio sp.]